MYHLMYLAGWFALGWLTCEFGHMFADRRRFPYEFKKEGLTIRSSDAQFIEKIRASYRGDDD